MRFMKQKEESEIREKLAEEQKAREKAAHWTLETADADNETMPIVIIEDGVSDNPMLGRAGRQSFGNFNPALERTSGSAKPKQTTKQEGEGEIVEVTETAKKLIKAKSIPRKGERKLLGMRGGVAKRETRPLTNRHHVKKKRSHKGLPFSRPN